MKGKSGLIWMLKSFSMLRQVTNKILYVNQWNLAQQK